MRGGQVSAVLFDLDGTLIDSAPDLGLAADAMRVDRGLPSLPLSAYRPVAGAGARGLLGVAFGISPEASEFDAMREEFFQRYERRMMDGTLPFDGVETLISTLLQNGRAWGVVTNKPRRFTEPLTAAMPLFASAAAIVSGDSTPHAKPHPAPLLEAARQMGVEPQACIYVGDDERDIMAGRAAGMRTVAACYGYMGAQPEIGRWNADAAIDSPNELLKLLDLT